MYANMRQAGRFYTARNLSVNTSDVAVNCRSLSVKSYMREWASPCMLVQSLHWIVSTETVFCLFVTESSDCT